MFYIQSIFRRMADSLNNQCLCWTRVGSNYDNFKYFGSYFGIGFFLKTHQSLNRLDFSERNAALRNTRIEGDTSISNAAKLKVTKNRTKLTILRRRGILRRK